MKVTIPMRKALAADGVLAHAMVGKSWANWRVLLIAASGGSLSRAERRIYKTLTGRDREPGHMIDLGLFLIGRRGGKSRAMSVFMVWLATCVSWDDVLSLGERGICLIIAPSERQAQITEQYIRSIIDGSPLLASLVEDRTQHVLSLRGQVGIEVMAANSRTVRGITAVSILMDETAYLPSSEDSANSDVSLLEAVRPCVSTTSGPVLMCSSPATMVGITYNIWKRHFGPSGSPDVIVVQSDTRSLNPRFRQSVLDKAISEDSEAAGEYSGEFKQALGQYIPRATVEACVEKGVTERAPLANMGIVYQGFVDQASGSGTDSFAAGIELVAARQALAILEKEGSA